jgi:hypothetical protein
MLFLGNAVMYAKMQVYEVLRIYRPTMIKLFNRFKQFQMQNMLSNY